MNILVLAPHPDDECIGCGGALCRHADRGDRVVAVFLTSGELGLERVPREQAWAIRETEARQAAKVLGLAETFFLRCPDWMLGDNLRAANKALCPIVKQEKLSLIYAPHPHEQHPDHRAAARLLRSVLRVVRPKAPIIRGYEVWTPLTQYDHVENITDVMPRKIRALRAHRSQLVEFNYVSAVQGLNRFRGELAGKCRYAEVFQTLEFKQ